MAEFIGEPTPKDPTSVLYNGDFIALLATGETAVLNCAGKKMATDVVIGFGTDAGNITYNGTTTRAEAGQTATLHCADKVMETDVVVKVFADDTEVYTITVSAEVGVEITDNTAPATIREGETVIFHLYAVGSEDYFAPDVYVTGAEWSYESAEKFINCIDYTITLFNPTDDVVITVSYYKPAPDIEPEE